MSESVSRDEIGEGGFWVEEVRILWNSRWLFSISVSASVDMSEEKGDSLLQIRAILLLVHSSL